MQFIAIQVVQLLVHLTGGAQTINPSTKIYGDVTVTPWLILNVIANPNFITSDTSVITANLLNDSNGVYHRSYH